MAIAAALGMVLLAWPLAAQQFEEWDSPDSTNCWFYMDKGMVLPGSEEESIPWFPDHGVDGSGFVACPLDRVASWPPTGKLMFYPLHTYAAKSCPGYGPVNFLVNTQVVVHLNRLPLAHLPGAEYQKPAWIDGKLRLWVGQWDSEMQHAFYCYTKRMVVPWCTNWVPSSLVLQNDAAHWRLFAGAGVPVPVEQILAAPQQWGFGIEVDAESSSGSPPLMNWLGFDRLSIQPASCPPKTTWTVHPDPAVGADFRSISEAVGSPCVKADHTIEIAGGQTYHEIVFVPNRLKFCGAITNGLRPVLTAPGILAGVAGSHVTLEVGGQFLNLELHGTNQTQFAGSLFNGLSIMGPTLVSNCVMSGYTRMGFAGFCAANPNDMPSLFIANHVTHNAQGIGNGDVEHVYRYNLIAWNGVGAYTVSGSQARFLDNVIVSNITQGLEVWQYGIFPPNQTEIANNVIAYNGGHGVLLTYAQPANPNCPVIRDNIIAENQGHALHAVEHSDVRPPRLWALAAGCPSGTMADDGGVVWQVGGCYPRVDHNCFWKNGTSSADLADNFYSITLTVGGESRTYATVPRGGRFLFTGCFSEDPQLTSDWRIAPGSPCVNAGSLYLDPGVSLSDGRRDRGWLDMGCHSPAVLNPELLIQPVDGDQLVIRAENLELDARYQYIFVVEPTWSTPFGSFEIIVSPGDLRGRKSRFFWLR